MLKKLIISCEDSFKINFNFEISEMLDLDANKMRIAHILGIVVISGNVSNYLLRKNDLQTYFSS